MKIEEVVGLLGLLLGLFLFGILINLDYFSLSIFIAIGGLIFFILYTKNTYVIFGCMVLVFVLLLYLFNLPGLEFVGNQTNITSPPPLHFPEYYIPTIILLLIVIIGFAIAYKASH